MTDYGRERTGCIGGKEAKSCLLALDGVVEREMFAALFRTCSPDLTGWLWTGLIERISQDRRSRTCGEVKRRARSRWC
jgi:hypothetical protein